MSMLDKKEHSRILADIERICTIAGVQGHFLYESMTKHCGPEEIDWVRRFWTYKKEGLSGLVLEGIARPDTRCQAMAAALVRNYIDARVVPLNTLLEEFDRAPTVLLIPNLYVIATMGKNIPVWKIQGIYDVLLDRATKGKPSVVYVESLQGVMTTYGVPFRDFLNRFKLVHDSTSS